MTPETRTTLNSLAAKYQSYFETGIGFTLTQEERAAGTAYPDTLNGLTYPERRPLPIAETPSVRVLEWWTAESNHITLGEGIERWEHRNVAYRSREACLDAIEAWARVAVTGPHAADICHEPTRALGLFEEDGIQRRTRGKISTEARLTSATVGRDEKGRVSIRARWDVRVIATREEPVSVVVEGVECRGTKPVVTVIRDWAPYKNETGWNLAAEHHSLDLKWATGGGGT